MQANRKEDPLKHFAVVVRLLHRIEGERRILIVVLCKVEQDGGSLENGEVAASSVSDRGDPAVGVQLDKPD